MSLSEQSLRAEAWARWFHYLRPRACDRFRKAVC